MFTLSKALALLSVALLVSGRAAPHARGLSSHHALAARLAAPVAAPVPVPVEARVVKPRRLSKRQNRCRARQEKPTPPPVVANPAPAPPTASPDPPASSRPAPSPSPPAPSPPPPPPPPPPAPPANNNNGNNNGGGNNGGNNGGVGINLPSFLIGTQTGQGTFYDIGLGACGIVNSGNDRIAAVSHLLFDKFPGYNGANPNNNPICGRRVNVQFEGKTTSVAITDRCEACAETDLDFSPAAFADIAAFARGRINNIKWEWA